MINRRTAVPEDDFAPLEVQRPRPRKEERAHVLNFGRDEIGLLDIVLWDAMADSETCRR